MTDTAPVLLCCLLWAHPGQEDALTAYEDEVLALLPDHGAAAQRVRSAVAVAADQPTEVQLYRFPSQQALDAYLSDPRRLALADRRDAAIARTELFPVREV